MASSTWLVSDLVEQLQADSWREQQPFSDDMHQCHQVLFDPHRTRKDKIESISGWLGSFQPCLFGQMEAKQKRVAFCLLTENDLVRSDDHIRQRIEEERLGWKRRASAGDSHAFILMAVSEKIAWARPSPALLNLAKRLCDLYLGVSEENSIFHDELILEFSEDGRPQWRAWKVGVNYFSAQGDGRWWRDHRIPGGMAYSMNSVGHMARTHVERAMLRIPEFARRLATAPREKLVYWALPKAMRTIGVRQVDSTRGTWLVERGWCHEDTDPPTYEMRQRVFGELAQFSENRYKGLYHTDETIPSPYFDPDLWRREDLVERHDLFFNYLHLQSEEDYLSMGIGVEIEQAEGGQIEVRSESGATHDLN